MVGALALTPCLPAVDCLFEHCWCCSRCRGSLPCLPCAHLHAVVDVQEVVRVQAGVVLHLPGQRPDAPVRQLVALVRLCTPIHTLCQLVWASEGAAQGLALVLQGSGTSRPLLCANMSSELPAAQVSKPAMQG